MSIVRAILEDNNVEASKKINEMILEHARRKIVEVKKMISVQEHMLPEDYGYEVVSIDESRFKIVRARVRKGKILRRHKEAEREGYTIRGGKVTKMKPAERRKRKLSQRKAAKKRKAKISRARVNMKKALRKRKALGI